MKGGAGWQLSVRLCAELSEKVVMKAGDIKHIWVEHGFFY